jgi:hypothetical protein
MGNRRGLNDMKFLKKNLCKLRKISLKGGVRNREEGDGKIV